MNVADDCCSCDSTQTSPESSGAVRVLAADPGLHLAQIVRLERSLFPKNECLADRLESEFKKKSNQFLVAVQTEAGLTSPLISKHDQKRAGHVASAVVGYLWINRMPSAMQIHKIAVAKEQQHRGIATALLSHIFSSSKASTSASASRSSSSSSSSSWRLYVDPAREHAVKLYQKFHFVVEKTMHRYYHDGRDALLMVRQTQPSSHSPVAARR